MGWTDARDKAMMMVLPSKEPPGSDQSDQSSQSAPTEPEPEPEPTTPTTTPTTTSKMLDCDAPPSPKNGDPFGGICKEGVAQGSVDHLAWTMARHAKRKQSGRPKGKGKGSKAKDDEGDEPEAKRPRNEEPRGTYGAGLTLVAALVAAGRRGRCASFAWQVWHSVTPTSLLRGTRVRGSCMSLGSFRLLCEAGAAVNLRT
eukprot:s1830_g32.t1